MFPRRSRRVAGRESGPHGREQPRVSPTSRPATRIADLVRVLISIPRSRNAMSAGSALAEALERREDALGDLVDLTHTVHLDEQVAVAVDAISGSVCSAYTSWRRRMTSSVSSGDPRTGRAAAAAARAPRSTVSTTTASSSWPVNLTCRRAPRPAARVRGSRRAEAGLRVGLVDAGCAPRSVTSSGRTPPCPCSPGPSDPAGCPRRRWSGRSGRDRGDAEVLGDVLRLGALPAPGARR